MTASKQTVEDIYPSRTSDEEKIIDRQDPVIDGDINGKAGNPLPLEDLSFYEETGFLFFRYFFDEAEVEKLTEEAERLRSDKKLRDHEAAVCDPVSGRLRSLFSIEQFSPVLDKLLRDKRVVDVMQQLLGGEVYVHQSRVNFRPGFGEKPFPWHTDFETWHVEDGMPRMKAISVSIGLDETSEFNGPLMFVPGSHRKFVSCAKSDRQATESTDAPAAGLPSQDTVTRLVEEGGGLTMPKGPAGSLLLFDSNILHGSAGNISPYPRTNLFIAYNRTDNALVEPFGGLPARPERLARRDATAVKPEEVDLSA
jgi:ectoine hydroxylase